MGLKLFHITEYAESMFLSPESQREATHPWVIMLASSLWLTVVGNWALWRALFKLPEFSTATPWGLVVTLMLMVTCAIGLLLCVLNWHFTLKPAITLVFFLVAFNTHVLLLQDGFLNSKMIQRVAQNPPEVLRGLSSWRLFFTVGVLGAAPAIWLWRTSIRRVTFIPNLVQNVSFILLLGAVLGALWLIERHAMTALFESQPQLAELISPFNTLGSLAKNLKGE
jgi:lipid A ethanolaminephosphotransferase